MKAEIIAVGTEILVGDIVNTNAQFLSKELFSLGIDDFFTVTMQHIKTHTTSSRYNKFQINIKIS